METARVLLTLPSASAMGVSICSMSTAHMTILPKDSNSFYKDRIKVGRVDRERYASETALNPTPQSEIVVQWGEDEE